MSKRLSTSSAWVIAIAAAAGGVLLLRRGRNSIPTLIINENGEIMKNYFSDKEFTRSDTAKRYGLANEPDEAAWQRIHRLRDNILNPARERLGYPVYITSGYRSNYVNQLVGGESNSQHTTGEAADITTKDRTLNRALFEILVSLGNFDQLIWEKGGEWIHVSYAGDGRGQILSYNGSNYQNITNNWKTAIVLL